MKRIIILVEIVIIILLLYVSWPKAETEEEGKYFLMTTTAYSNHQNCIANKWRDGLTAMGTSIREGIVAINVDYVNGKWVVRSPLKLGQKIYIEELGYFSVEDTGRFAERDEQQDIWTVDIYIESYEKAVEFGRQLKKVYVINN